MAGAAHISVMYDGFASFAEQAFRRPSSLLQQPGPAVPSAAEVLSLLGPPHDIAGICVALFQACQRCHLRAGSGGLMVGALHAFSPLLRSLTYSFSHDTVIALTIICFALHLALFDYTWPSTSPPAERPAVGAAATPGGSPGGSAGAGGSAVPAAGAGVGVGAGAAVVGEGAGGLLRDEGGAVPKPSLPQGNRAIFGVLSLNMAVFGS